MTQTTSPSTEAGVRVVVDGRAMLLHLAEAGLACCAVEQAAGLAAIERTASLIVADASVERADAEGSGAGDTGVGAHGARGRIADHEVAVLVVSGTVTDVMAPLLERMYEALPEPRAVLSFGACSATGGPYWDSPVVMNGIDQRLPVDVYVPGCPPRPEALLAGLRALAAGLGFAPLGDS